MLDRFSAPVREWFEATFGEPTPPQSQGWPAIAEGSDTLICAPTGSGKTLSAFLWSIDELVKGAAYGELPDETAMIYVSPLKALGNDIQKNLEEPLRQIRALAAAKGLELPEIRVAVRSGDTPASERTAMVKRPPHILITTPESLYILLTADNSRRFLRTAKAVIVDEIHAIAQDKRGSHLALTLERLDRAAGRRLQRIGLSATQKPIEEVARLLIGTGRERPDGSPDCSIVDVGHRRSWDLSVWVPEGPLGPIASHELRGEILSHIAKLSTEHRTTLVFVNTRRLVERVAHELSDLLGEGRVAAHHGSLSRAIRLKAEQGLKSGEVPVVVATASLELGIDIGHVDLVCHIGSPRAIATMLQRVGRSGHGVLGTPKGVLFPMTRDELLQCAACVHAANSGELDRLTIPPKPLDVLAQQIVAEAAAGELGEEEAWELSRRAYPYRDLTREEFDDIVEMLSEGVATSRGRRSAWLHRDRVNGVVKGRRGAKLAAVTSGGAIPDVADYDVVEDPTETFVGKVNEDFAIESMAGDIFLLGNTSWKIRRVESGRVRVEDAAGQPPTIPFWTGEAPARSQELSAAVARLRQRAADGISDRAALLEWLMSECGVDLSGAEQIASYVAETVAVLGTVPTQDRIVAERFFDEGGGMQLVVHAPFGAAINRAWGLALRKRFCVTFDFELQAAATDDGIILSLGEQHSFPLPSVFNFVKTPILTETLTQAVLQHPVFGTRFRWNASRSLALLRSEGGKRVPAPIQRMRAEDLMAAVFPEQVACQDNNPGGRITPPDHPIVTETVRNCLNEWMDTEGLRAIITELETGGLETVAVETPEPSQMSHEILNANPYAFLDDAPLEERRARAVALRRVDPDLARDVGALDPAAIDEVREQAAPDVRDAVELHDHLLDVVLLPVEEPDIWGDLASELIAAGRVTVASWAGHRAYVAAEREALARIIVPEATFDPPVSLPPDRMDAEPPSRELAVRGMIQGWMATLGPATVEGLATRLGLAPTDVKVAMAGLESIGVVLRGSFTPGTTEEEWCDRRLLARIHRLTIHTLRKEIQPVSAAEYMRFLLSWQHLTPGTQLHGRDGLLAVIGQLEGFELAAPAWESRVLPARVARYDPDDLEYLCLSGTVSWGRLTPDEDEPPGENGNGKRRSGPTRATPITFMLREDTPLIATPRSAPETQARLSVPAKDVARFLAERGASFLTEIADGTNRMNHQVEEALWELVSAGLVTGDGVAGLRRLLRITPRSLHAVPPLRRRWRGLAEPRRPGVRALPVGRWALWRTGAADVEPRERIEAFAGLLLRRYGVVFRELLARERRAPAWRSLLEVFRRWEARQEVRGGRFVSGFVGEQFALPEAVEALRAARRTHPDDRAILVSAADPANLVGIVTPGPRVPPNSGLVIAYRDGVPIGSGPMGQLRSKLRASGDLPVADATPG
jgi:ATP-dependent Lhr-like helicase